jgi:caffeic acid 3-O-methyltransferase
VKILRNCYRALGEGRKVIVIDPFEPPVAPETTVVGRFASQYDSIMSSMFGGGKERTEMEFKALALAAGFSSSRLACSACGFRVMEFTK